MIDTREQILNRILAICTESGGMVSAVRNRALLKTEKRPAVILLDGDETQQTTHPRNGRTSGRMMPLTPQIMTMRPELYILLEDKKVEENTVIGPETNAARIRLCKAIGEDEQLLMLLGSNGGIVYNGAATDLKSGSALTGQMRLDFAYTYTFFPTTDQQGVS